MQGRARLKNCQTLPRSSLSTGGTSTGCEPAESLTKRLQIETKKKMLSERREKDFDRTVSPLIFLIFVNVQRSDMISLLATRGSARTGAARRGAKRISNERRRRRQLLRMTRTFTRTTIDTTTAGLPGALSVHFIAFACAARNFTRIESRSSIHDPRSNEAKSIGDSARSLDRLPADRVNVRAHFSHWFTVFGLVYPFDPRTRM